MIYPAPPPRINRATKTFVKRMIYDPFPPPSSRRPSRRKHDRAARFMRVRCLLPRRARARGFLPRRKNYQFNFRALSRETRATAVLRSESGRERREGRGRERGVNFNAGTFEYFAALFLRNLRVQVSAVSAAVMKID